LQRAGVDLIVLAGFMRVLSPYFIQKFEHSIINIHPSLLPKYKGLHTHARAIAAGETTHGATVHYVTAELDGGPLIAYGDVSVNADDTPETLAQRVLSVEHRLLPDVVRAIALQRINRPPEPILLDGGVKAPFHYSQIFSM
jgi:phosphoribosylglycinamide formyltransferase-1